MTTAVVHCNGGSVRLEGADVVVQLAGTRTNARGKTVPWNREFRAPVGRARAELRGRELTVYRDDRPIQAVAGCHRAEVQRFLAELDDAWSHAHEPAPPAPAPAVVTTECSTCGAPGKVSGEACRYCRAV